PFGKPSIHRVVDRDVVLKRIGARDVVVVWIFGPPDEAAGLIFPAGDGFELHFHETVFQARLILEADWVGSSTGLFQHVGRAGRGRIFFTGPLRVAGAGRGRGPAGRRRARF